jgi:hypothetical protein
MRRADRLAISQNHGAFERIAKLADVPGPVVFEQRLAGALRQ